MLQNTLKYLLSTLLIFILVGNSYAQEFKEGLIQTDLPQWDLNPLSEIDQSSSLFSAQAQSSLGIFTPEGYQMSVVAQTGQTVSGADTITRLGKGPSINDLGNTKSIS